MSRTYRKNISLGIAGGDNREWYKLRRRNFRRKFNNNLRYLLSNFSIKELSDLVLNPKYPKRDTWTEPTDGRILYNKDIVKNKLRTGRCNIEYLENICSKYLKFKLKKK